MAEGKSDNQVAVEYADKIGEGDPNVVTLSTGIQMEIKQVPSLVMMGVLAQMDRPSPPVYWDETLEREMENPDHPDYVERLERYELEFSVMVLDALIIWGTKPVSIPDGLEDVASDDWVEKLKLTGTKVNPASKNWRYLYWVKTIALGDENDAKLLTSKVGGKSGVAERDVELAADTFRGEKGK